MSLVIAVLAAYRSDEVTPRDLMTIALRTLAAWLFASGTAGLASALSTWRPTSQDLGAEAAALAAAVASIFIPIGGLLWVSASTLARWSFPEDAQASPFMGTRGDLYAFASALVGMFLLTDAVSQVAYWVVVWRSAGGTNFWDESHGQMENTVVYWVHVRAQTGLLLAKLAMGTLFMFGPQRVSAGIRWLRRDLSGGLGTIEPADNNEGSRDGG
jgi:hypothetical protein